MSPEMKVNFTILVQKIIETMMIMKKKRKKMKKLNRLYQFKSVSDLKVFGPHQKLVVQVINNSIVS